MEKTTDLTKGKVSKVILDFFFPMLFTNMLQQIYTVADTAIVGKGLGDDKLAAVGNMSSLTFLVFGFAMGLSNGFSIITAQNFGAGDYRKLKLSTAAIVRLFVIFAAVLTAASTLSLRFLMNVLRTDEVILDDSLRYGYIIFGGLAVTLAYNVASGILRALGDSKTPFRAIIASSAVNIVLDFLFIFVLKTGVEGAAAATVFSQLISTAVCLARLRTISEIRFSRDDMKNCGGFTGILLSNGIPMALMSSITAIGSMVLQSYVNALGVAYTTSYSASSKYVSMFMQPACTAGFTMSSYTSQNYGAGEYGRIREGLRVCNAIALISYIILGSAMVFFPRQLSLLMMNGDEPVNLTVSYMPICGVMLFAVDFLFVYRSGVQGMGHPGIPMISGILEMVIRVVVVVLMIDSAGYNSTAYAQTAAWFGALVMNYAAFRYYLGKRINTGKTVSSTVGS